MGRLVSAILIESKLVDSLNLERELHVEIGSSFNGRNLKSMSLISDVVERPEDMDVNFISTRRTPVDDFPFFNLVRFPEPPTRVV